MSLNSSVSAMMTCPSWPQLGSWAPIPGWVCRYSAGWESKFKSETREHEKQHLTLPTDGARWQPVALPGGLQEGSAGLEGPGPRYRTGPGVALTPQPHTGSGHSAGRHGNEQRYPKACRSPHFARAPTQLGVQGLPPKVPTALRPQTQVLPAP